MSDRAISTHRSALAAELRRQGLGYDAIVETIGYANRSGAWKAVQRALRLRQTLAADALVQQSFMDLDILHERSWPAAAKGDPVAADRCMRALQLRVRLVERFARELGIDEREGAADAADAYLASQGDNGYVSRDPREVFENSEAFVFVCVSGRVRNRSLVVDKKTSAVRSVVAPEWDPATH